MIHKRILAFLIAFLPIIIIACSDDNSDNLISKQHSIPDMERDTWTQNAKYYNSDRYGTVTFVINRKAYISCGYDGNYLRNFYAFNPAKNNRIQIKDISDSFNEDYYNDYTIRRTNLGTFIIDEVTYPTYSENKSTCNDTWKYHPIIDLWEDMAKFKGTVHTLMFFLFWRERICNI